MYDQIGQSMVREETVDFLQSQGHGTLCLASANRGYGIPMSYSYDEDSERLILELIYVGESKKRQFLQDADKVTLTTYEHQDVETWASVVVTGEIHELSRDEVSERYAALFFSEAEDAAGDLRWINLEDFEREWYALEIEDLTGRHSGSIPSS